MFIDIPAPFGTPSVTFQLSDISRIEVTTLTHSGNTTHCLYLIFGKGKNEHFYLFNYKCSKNLRLAYQALSAARKNSKVKNIVMRPVAVKPGVTAKANR